MRYAILGTTQAAHDDGSTVAVGGARLRALLTALALRPGRAVPAALLVAEVWDADPPAEAVPALQALVGRLRRALGHAAVRSVEGGYLLEARREDIDAFRFERLVRAGAEAPDPARAAALYDEALALWRGPALASLPEATAESARWEAVRMDARRGRPRRGRGPGRGGAGPAGAGRTVRPASPGRAPAGTAHTGPARGGPPRGGPGRLRNRPPGPLHPPGHHPGPRTPHPPHRTPLPAPDPGPDAREPGPVGLARARPGPGCADCGPGRPRSRARGRPEAISARRESAGAAHLLRRAGGGHPGAR